MTAQRRGQALAISCAVCSLLMVGSQALLPAPNRIVAAVGFAAQVWSATSPSFSGLPVWRPLVDLGAASYAIYLVHNPAPSRLVRLLPAGTSHRHDVRGHRRGCPGGRPAVLAAL